MKLEKVRVSDIDAKHLENGCFHYLNLIEDPSYLPGAYIVISDDRKLFGVSLSVYKSLIKHEITSINALIVSDKYLEKLDLFMQNITSNTTLLYHKVKQHFPQAENVNRCEFDKNQLDLMYCIDLDADESMDVRTIEEEMAKIKKTFNVTVVLKTLEHNFTIQKFFDTNLNEINYDYFKQKVTGSYGFIEEHTKEHRDDQFYKNNTYPEFTIISKTIDQMNDVLNFFKINKDSIKTTRLNFKKIEGVLK